MTGQYGNEEQGYAKKENVCENALLGRHLVATRDIKEGVVVLKELPLVAGPPQITPPVCLGCYRTLDLFGSRECATCGWPLCSDKCGKSQAHKPECHITSTRRGAKGGCKRTLVTLLPVREADYNAKSLVTLLPVREADYRAKRPWLPYSLSGSLTTG
uniref:Uncharacterized protein n=1 Tax=Timema bartmani TaxID=61472 RepID=A0A7R9ETY7_9NEOP|nr:unnamed protein product [Timema bartmani]